MPDEMDEVVVCKYCGRKEIYGRMMWQSGKCSCRACYIADYEKDHEKPYKWHDLDWTDKEKRLLEEAEENHGK